MLHQWHLNVVIAQNWNQIVLQLHWCVYFVCTGICFTDSGKLSVSLLGETFQLTPQHHKLIRLIR